ncbi:MAG: Trk system potassium transporter TrkA [Clostridia bacterium]|nr:Trk system potassium transporter TrkA [Clostridia bacterium]
MNIVIVGCGKIGRALVENLSAEGHDITVIDNNPTVVSEITNMYDVIGLCGNGADSDILVEAGIENVELFAAFSGSDELNMLSCFVARRMGAKHTIARIRNLEYNDRSLGILRQHLNLSMAVNPEKLAAREIFNILKFPSALKIENFSARNFEMVEIRLKSDSALDGMTIEQMRKKYDYKFLICVVQRGDSVTIPDGNFVLRGGDKVAITADPIEVQKLLKHVGVLQKQARNVMIIGASRTAYYLSKMLLGIGCSVKVVDSNLEKCENFSELLSKVDVVYGDAAKEELLLEEGLGSMDAFVSLTGMDEENILLSYYASSHNTPKVVSKVNRTEFSDMAEKLGIDSIISPKIATTDIIVRYARALKNSMGSSVETMYKLMDGKVEAIEFYVRDDCEVIDVPLKNIRFKSNILIGGIIREKKTVIIPSGDDVIKANDKVVVLTAGHRIESLDDVVDWG